MDRHHKSNEKIRHFSYPDNFTYLLPQQSGRGKRGPDNEGCTTVQYILTSTTSSRWSSMYCTRMALIFARKFSWIFALWQLQGMNGREGQFIEESLRRVYSNRVRRNFTQEGEGKCLVPKFKGVGEPHINDKESYRTVGNFLIWWFGKFGKNCQIKNSPN